MTSWSEIDELKFDLAGLSAWSVHCAEQTESDVGKDPGRHGSAALPSPYYRARQEARAR